jgi:hypothetical protein
MRFLVLALLGVATTAAAQNTKTPPATKTAAPAPGATQQDAKTKAAGPAAGAQRRPALTIAPESTTRARVPVIMREAFDYDAGGRRDPFFSLMTSAELRPTIADLRLTGVLVHPTRPVAVLRDIGTNTQYRVTLGSTLGRMRVALIKPRVVIFSIEEFGLNRQDSLVLRDTTKARTR